MLIPEFKWSETIAILRENKNNVPIRFGPPSMSSEGELRGFANSMVGFRTDLPRCSCCDQLGTMQCSAQAHTHRHAYRHRLTYNFLACRRKLLPQSIPGAHLNGYFIHINPVKRCRTLLFTSQIINYPFASLSHSSQIKESRCHQPSLVQISLVLYCLVMLAQPLDTFCLEVTYPIQVLYLPFHSICATGLLAEGISNTKMQPCSPRYLSYFPPILLFWF